MQTIFDVSMAIREQMPVWEGDPQPEIRVEISIGTQGRIQVTSMHAGAHIGTHIDAPLHFIENGRAIEDLDLTTLIGPCQVVEVGDEGGLVMKKHIIPAISSGIKRLILKTRNSKQNKFAVDHFIKEYVALDHEAADYLVEAGVRLVGIDYLSIAPFNDVYPVHQILLGAGVVVIEGLMLHSVPPGEYGLIALPIKLEGSDGAPARVVLTREGES